MSETIERRPNAKNGARANGHLPAPEGAGLAAAGSLALAAQIEAVLFVADAPVAVADLARALDARPAAVEHALAELALSYGTERGIRLQRAGTHVQLATAPEAAAAVARFLGLEQSGRLSRAALETLSIVAYRQPVTRPEIDALRGVDCDGVMRSLLARGLVETVGRRTTVGHPVEYGTTFVFLEYFGLTSLGELPAVELVAAERPVVAPALFAALDGAPAAVTDGALHAVAGGAQHTADDGAADGPAG